MMKDKGIGFLTGWKELHDVSWFIVLVLGLFV